LVKQVLLQEASHDQQGKPKKWTAAEKRLQCQPAETT
jgi:hypothetical protein